jgi:hypothetical protein
MKYLIYLIAMLTMLASVFAAADLNITTNNDVSATYNQGIVSGSFTVRNDGDANATLVSFTGDFTNSSNVLVNYLTTSQNITVGESVVYNYNINVTNQEAKTYVSTLSASGYSVSGDTASVLSIAEHKSILPSLSSNSIDVAKGNSRTITLSIQNTGNTQVSATYLVSNTQSIGVDSSIHPYVVAYGSTQSVSIPLSVNSGVANGAYVLNLRVYYDATNYVDKTFTVNVVDPSTSVGVSGTTDVQTVDLESSNTYTFTVTNSGTASTNVTVSLSGLVNDFDDFNYSPSSFALSAGASQTVTVLIDNSDEDTRTQDTEYDVTYKGVFTVVGGGNTSTYTLSLKTKSELEIDSSSFKVRQNGVKKSGKSISSVYPGDIIEIDFDIKNLYDENIELSDYVVNVLIENIDNGDDLELEDVVSGGSISDGDEDTVKINFTVPLLAERKSYTVQITVDGTDENGNTFQDISDDVKLSITKQSHKMGFENVKLDGNTITCDYSSLRYTGKLVNLGKSTEKDVVLTSEIVGNSRYTTSTTFNVDQEDYETISELFDLTDLTNGAYTLRITAEYYGSAKETMDLSFKVDCEPKKGTIVVVPPKTTPDVPPVNNNDFTDLTPVKPVDKTSTNIINKDMIYIAVLIVLIIGVFAGIIVLLSKLIKRI